MNKKQNALRISIFGIISTLINTIIPFFMRMELKEILGDKYLGINNLFHSIFNVLLVIDLDFGKAIQYKMYEPISKNDDYKVCALLNVYKKICFIISFLILIMGICLAPFLRSLINGNPPEGINIYIVYTIYLLEIVLSYSFLSCNSLLMDVMQRGDIVSKVTSVVNILSYFTRIIFLMVYKNYYVYIVFLPITVMINGIIIKRICKNKFPNYKCYGVIDFNERRSIISKTSSLSIATFCSKISDSISTIFISSYIGLKEVAMYSNYLYVLTSLQRIISNIIGSTQTALGLNVSLKEKEETYADLGVINYVNMWLLTCTGVCMYCSFQNFIKLWMGESSLLSDFFVLLLFVYYYISCVRYPIQIVKNATGLWEKDKYKSLLSTIIIIIVNVLYIKKIGIICPLISLILVSLLERPIEIHVVFEEYFKFSSFCYYLKQIKYISVMIVCMFVCSGICKLFLLDNTFIFIIKSFLCFLVCNVIFISLTYRTKEFATVIGVFKNLFRFHI